jgi:hypothetical protein
LNNEEDLIDPDLLFYFFSNKMLQKYLEGLLLGSLKEVPILALGEADNMWSKSLRSKEIA